MPNAVVDPPKAPEPISMEQAIAEYQDARRAFSACDLAYTASARETKRLYTEREELIKRYSKAEGVMKQAINDHPRSKPVLPEGA